MATNNLKTQPTPYNLVSITQAVKDNDIEFVVDVLKNKDLSEVQIKEALAQVLVFSPLRREMLNKVNEVCPLRDLDVLAQATSFINSFAKPDWEAILDWYQDQFGQQTPRILARNITEMSSSYIGSEQKGVPNQSAKNGMLKILDRYPELIGELEPTSQSYLCLFKLSANKNAGNWLAESGKVQQVLYWGIKSRAVSKMLSEDSSAVSLDQWLAKSPTHQQAWDEIVRQDQIRVGKHLNWLDTWVPHGFYQGSPLEEWVKQTKENPDGWMERSSPLGHSLFQETPLPMDGKAEKQAAEMYEAYMRREKSPSVIRARLISVNESVLKDINSWHEALHHVPVNKIALAMDGSVSATKDIMKDPAKQAQVAALLEDPRMKNVIFTWKINDVLRWATSKHWLNWTNDKGQGLLEISLNSDLKTNNPNTTLLCRLAKEHPRWFTDSQGLNLINRLALDEKARVVVLKAALEGTAKNSRTDENRPSTVKKPAM